MKYKVNEFFYSLQGEGLLQGLPMVFLRFSGCNLKCPFCDTKYAWKEGKLFDAKKVVEKILKYGCRQICLTGGEPFLQDLSPIVEMLKEKDFWITAETNGTLWQEINLDWLTVSPKRQGEKYHPGGYDKRFKNTAREFKYVITEEKDFTFIDKTLTAPVILQPVDNNKEIADKITDFLKKEKKEQWYMKFQMHKIFKMK
jgi:7-carboxy-7-deazaguanine synthase